MIKITKYGGISNAVQATGGGWMRDGGIIPYNFAVSDIQFYILL